MKEEFENDVYEQLQRSVTTKPIFAAMDEFASQRNIEVTSVGSLGGTKLLFSNAIELLDKNDTVTISLPEANNWVVKLNFIDDDDKVSMGAEIKYGQGLVDITFNKWYSDTWVYNKSPFTVLSKDNKLKIHIQVRTAANKINQRRLVIASIWKSLEA